MNLYIKSAIISMNLTTTNNFSFGIFKAMVDQSSSVEADYYLEAYISQMHADFTNSQYFAAIAIQFVVLDYRTEMPAMVFSGSYESQIPLTHNTPQDVVNSYEAALCDILSKFESDLVAKLQG